MNETLNMKGWKSYLLWEGLPFLMLLFIFGFISAENWEYESKLITPDTGAPDWTDVHLGLLLLALALGMALIASVLLFVVRIIAARISRPDLSMGFRFAALIVVTVLLIFPGLFIVILGPAATTMMEQTRVAPR